jgi:predicted lipoprotein with Yx(FWY)xxD motif
MQIARPRIVPAAAALAAAIAAAAFGGSYASAQPSSVRAPQAGHAKRALVKLRKTSYGKVLVDSGGRTLYLYTPDSHGKSVCYGQCASYWPPLLSAGKPRAGTGVKASLLGVTMRTDGKHQVTYAGHPLYLFAQDSKPGQTNGEDVQGIWYVVSAAGKQVEKKAETTTTQTTTTTSRYSNGGY